MPFFCPLFFVGVCLFGVVVVIVVVVIVVVLVFLFKAFLVCCLFLWLFVLGCWCFFVVVS